MTYAAPGHNDERCDYLQSTWTNSHIYGIPEPETKTLIDRPGSRSGRLPAPNGKSGTSPMVSHDEDSHDIANDTNEEMIRESLQVYAAEITVANRERFRPLAGLLHIISKLGIKFVGELPRRNSLIICHDLVDIRITFGCRTRRISFGGAQSVDQVAPALDRRMDSFRARRRVEGPRLSPRRREGPAEAIQGGELPIPPCRFQTSREQASQFQRLWP